MKPLAWLGLVMLMLAAPVQGRLFTVLTYNVENLFDVDGIALYDDYRQPPEGVYDAKVLLRKLEGVRRTLAAINDGKGPEVILFQEFELDQTPQGTPEAARFLEKHRGTSLAELLDEDGTAHTLPVELMLLKYLEDHGMGGYAIAQPDYAKLETYTPHKNVIFTRFPIDEIRQRPMASARDLLIATILVDGHPVHLLDVHWKSGASNASTEPIRVQNALVTRAAVEAILLDDPAADIILAGDFNSYYNHSAANPHLELTGMNDILQPTGFEDTVAGAYGRRLYNLWFELPAEERGSEVYRGQWGTLMQMLISSGMYDNEGVQYVDNSFARLILPGENVEARWQRPVAWSNAGGGGGYSDHLPVYAQFRRVSGEAEADWMKLDEPTREEHAAYRPGVAFPNYRGHTRPADRRAGAIGS